MKNEAYSPGDDALEYFKDVAALEGRTPIETCFSLAAKHVMSARNLCRDAKNGRFPTDDRMNEVFKDMAAFTVLMQACILDMRAAYAAKGGAKSKPKK